MHQFRKTAAGFFVAHNATILGDVDLAADVSVWFGAVIRGDVARISIGRGTNVHDLAVIHCDSGVANVIEEDVTIGHSAIVHGVFVGRGSLIGMGAKLLGGTKIGRDCLIAAGAVLPPNMVVPDNSVVMGVPAKVVRPVNDADLKYMRWLAPHYVELARKHAAGQFVVGCRL
jgi:carbonic anhydrase/acetyltransferase-like protein (isoleucine patch superfamily)